MDEFFSKPVFDRIIEENEIVAKPCSVATIDMAKATVDDLEVHSHDSVVRCLDCSNVGF